MPGKKPKERQRYMLRVNDTLVEVTRAVYLAWYQAGRKERYQVEKMQRHGVCSMEELQEKGYDCSFSVLSPEEIIIRLSEIQELEEALGYLTKEDAELITLLFFEEFTVKETAQYFGCCPKTIRNRRKKVLEKLKEQLENTKNNVEIKISKKFFKQVNFCPFTHAVSEGANVYLQFKKINPLKNCTLTISYQQREDTRNFSATHFCGGNPVKT